MVTNVHLIMLTNGAFATTSSLFLNLLLGYLVIKHTPMQLKGYSRLMLMHCVADVLFDCTCFIIGGIVIPLKAQSFYVLQGLFMGVDGNMTDKLFTVQSWIGLTQILLIPIDFVYRYLSVCRNHELSTRSIGIMVFMSYLIVWFYMFPVKWWCQSTMAGPAPGMENYTAMLEGVPEWSGHDFSYSISAKDGTKPEWISSVYVIGMNAFTLLVIFYTSIRIHWTIGHKTSMSNNKKAMKIHRQVTKILVVQAALPLIVFIGPICAIIFCGLMRLQVPLIGFYCNISTMWFSSLKPFLTILIIERYRKHVYNWLCKSKTQTNMETTSWASSSTRGTQKTKQDESKKF